MPGATSKSSAHPVPLLALALLPMAAALAGAFLDERLTAGVTVWRSACRASGLALGSVIAFTLELLPCAVIGALAGGLAVLAFAVVSGSAASMRRSLAAHLGCVVAMPISLLLCALALPLPLMLAADALLAGLAAFAVLRALQVRNIPRSISAGANGRKPSLSRPCSHE